VRPYIFMALTLPDKAFWLSQCRRLFTPSALQKLKKADGSGWIHFILINMVSWQAGASSPRRGAKMILTLKTASSCERQYIFKDLLVAGPIKARKSIQLLTASAQNGLTASMVMTVADMGKY
jgi:hypothetical protein